MSSAFPRLVAVLVPGLAALLVVLAPHPAVSAPTDKRPANTCTAQFSDVPPGAYFYDPVLWLACQGAISGYSDGTFRPGNPTTRAQLTKIVVLAYGWPLLTPAQGHFSDVSPASPFYATIETAYARGIIGGYADGTFRPGNDVTRAQLSKIITLATGWTLLNPAQGHFGDVPPGSTFYSVVETAYAHGIISGYSDGSFRPGNPATRAQIAKIVYLTLQSGCAMFPADNIWNRDISTAPVHPLSASYIGSIGLSGHLHADFGSGTYQGAPIGIPWLAVAGSEPVVPVNFTNPAESDPDPYPIPLSAPIEGGPASGGDRHVLVMDQGGGCSLNELYLAYPQGNGSWQAYSGARWDLSSNALRPDDWTSADAAGLPILPGLIRYDEVAAGAIRHAVRFTVSRSQNTHLWPARHDAGSADAALPPMGLRVRLKADYPIAGFPEQARVILIALKRYGMIVADNGGDWYISGAPSPHWNNDALHALGRVKGSAFEVVDTSSMAP
jgi:S-layer homology domain